MPEHQASPLPPEETERILRPLFESEDEKIFQFTAGIFRHCILEKIFPPAEPLRRRFISPGGGYYGQWIWDTMFVVDLLALLPDTAELIREVFQNYWDFQERWDAATPEYAHGMITCQMVPGKDENDILSSFSQIPILAWGLERVYRRNGDLELVRRAIGPIERFHEWYWRERDVTNVGLVGVGNYTGAYRQAIYELFDWESDLDDMELTPHPARRYADDDKWYGVRAATDRFLAGPIHPMRMARQRNWYGNVLIPSNTSFLILAEDCLGRMAETAGDQTMAARRRARRDEGLAAMREHMWDEEAGTFLAVWRDSLRKIRVPTIGSWIPLLAGVPDAAQAHRMAQVLATPEWNTPLPVCTVERHSPHCVPGLAWHGGVWPATNFQVASGLARYGHRDLAGEFCDKLIASAMDRGVGEYYHCDTGEPCGVSYNGMSCTMVTMMLDGLTRRFLLRLKKR